MKALLVLLAILIALTACAGPNTIVETVKTDTGLCTVIIHENIPQGPDSDEEYRLPCEIKTDENVEQDK